jgi:hypothetical protein
LEAEGQTPNRTLEGLLKYAKEVEVSNTTGGQGEGDGEGKGEGENEPQVSTRPQVVWSFEYKPEGTKIQVLSDGSVKMSEGMTPVLAQGLLKAMSHLIQ